MVDKLCRAISNVYDGHYVGIKIMMMDKSMAHFCRV